MAAQEEGAPTEAPQIAAAIAAGAHPQSAKEDKKAHKEASLCCLLSWHSIIMFIVLAALHAPLPGLDSKRAAGPCWPRTGWLLTNEAATLAALAITAGALLLKRMHAAKLGDIGRAVR